MKNENNTQHTPDLAIFLSRDENYTALDVIVHVTDDRQAHAKYANIETAGNVDFFYIPVSLALRAPDLLKDNEQLKERIEALVDNHGLTKAKIKVIALQKSNAELLEALKETERYFTHRGGKGKMAKRVEALVQSAMAKAEGKTLGVS